MSQQKPAQRPLPRGVIGVIDDVAAGEILAGGPLAEGLGGVEVRADLLDSPDTALELVRRLGARWPVIFTARLAAQGGRWNGSEASRVELFRRAIAEGAAIVDAEWGSEAAARSIAGGIPVLLSWHDFGGMPAAAELQRMSRDMESWNPAALKVVPAAQRAADVVSMLEWVGDASPAGPPRVGFAMGEKGLPSRILCIARGAPFTYGSLATAVAPGQPRAADLVDLYAVSRRGSQTRLLAVAGNPVAHSLSPHIHNPALAAAGVDAVYVPWRLDSLAELEPCWEPLRIRGLSVTIPFKEEAARRADERDARVVAAGAANTLVALEPAAGGRARLRATNTDFEGVTAPLRKRLGDLSGLRVAIVGNGGAARGAAVALEDAACEVALVYRNAERGLPVARELGVAARPVAEIEPAEIDVLINATPLGLEPGDESPVPASAFRPGLVAFDMIYDPPATRFLELARQAGAATIGGGEMLVAQALEQFRLFTELEPDAELFAASFDRALAERRRRR